GGVGVGRPPPPRDGCVDVWVLDVGHGLSVVMQSAEEALVYDTAAASPESTSVAERVLLPFLRDRGIASVDELVISHADNDHAGGAADVIDNVVVGRVLAGEPVEGIDTERCEAGMTWYWRYVRFVVLHPGDKADAGNDASCVILAHIGDHRVLFSGDIESGVEAALVRSRVLSPVDVVIVPHHGSRTSSTGPFVRAVEPDIAIVSAAYRNHWGFPKPDVVARWRSVGARVLTTADSGAINIRICVDSGTAVPREWRKQRRRIWRRDDS
ncbi:MAG: ComEC/Rec2 family competence protein, partial [Woeseiaceae bacterium]